MRTKAKKSRSVSSVVLFSSPRVPFGEDPGGTADGNSRTEVFPTHSSSRKKRAIYRCPEPVSTSSTYASYSSRITEEPDSNHLLPLH